MVAALRESIRLVDAEFNLNLAQSLQSQHRALRIEHSKQNEERDKARESRKLQESEVQSAETERKLQAEERAKAQAERIRFAQQKQSEADETRDKNRHRIMKWLSRSDTVNPYLNALAKQSENPSSCRWIFETDEYQTWATVDDPSNALWIHSGPGTGKTILAGQIVRQLRENQVNDNAAVTFFFCNGVNASKDDPLAILRTILCQILDGLPDIPEWVAEQYRNSYLKGSESAQSLPFLDIRDLLSRTIDLFRRVHLILDGIDELSDRGDLLTYLTALGRRGVEDKVKVLVISRMESDIRYAIGNYLSLAILPSNTKNDMRNFISNSIRAKLDLQQSEASGVQKILFKRARGMFIWVRLVVDLLGEAANTDEYHEILREIPGGLHEIYCLVIEKIHKKVLSGPPSKKLRARSIFRWLALSFRPLKIQELQDALATEDFVDGTSSKDLSFEQGISRFRSTEKAIMDICGNLVDEENGAISLLHHTAREFLLSSSGFRSPEVQQYTVYANTGNAKITKFCLTYMINSDSTLQHLFDESVKNAKNRHDLRDAISSLYPFFEYACRQWPYHFGRCPMELNAEPLAAFPTFQLCTFWYQGWSLFHPSGRVPHSKLFQRIRKHGATVCAWLDLLNIMLGGFVSQSDVSLEDIAEYTSDAPLLLKERSAASFVNILNLETAAKLGYHSMVSQILKITSPSYGTVKPAFNVAIRKEHSETIAVLCEYLVTRDWTPHPIEIAEGKGDKGIEKILAKRLQERDTEIEKFLGHDPQKQKPRVFRMLPSSDAERKMFDRPYWEYDTPVSDRGNYLAYRNKDKNGFLREVDREPNRPQQQTSSNTSQRQPFQLPPFRDRHLPYATHVNTIPDDQRQIQRRFRLPAKPRTHKTTSRREPEGVSVKTSTSVTVFNNGEHVEVDRSPANYVENLTSRTPITCAMVDWNRWRILNGSQGGWTHSHARLAAYYLLTSSPRYAFSSILGPSFHLIDAAKCSPSNRFPYLEVFDSAIRERTWPTHSDLMRWRFLLRSTSLRRRRRRVMTNISNPGFPPGTYSPPY